MVQEHSSSKNKKAVLLLEDGTFFIGYGFGTPAKVSGEAVFSTSMVSHPETLADQSYKGQILRLTYSIVSDYGVPCYDANLDSGFSSFEYNSIHVTDLAITGLCRAPYCWDSVRTLGQWTANSVTINNRRGS